MATEEINSLAKQFTQFYYQQFDKDRAGLKPLYRPHSMLTFEDASLQGQDSIIEKLVSLPFKQVRHQVVTLDAQPTQPGSNVSVLVIVTGNLLIDEEQNPQRYSQVFHLVQEGPGSYYVLNDIFRLNYA